MPDYPTGPGRYAADINPYPGDALAADDPPTYPKDWTPEQRISAYWYAHGRGIQVRSTETWHQVLASAQRDTERHQRKVSAIRNSE